MLRSRGRRSAPDAPAPEAARSCCLAVTTIEPATSSRGREAGDGLRSARIRGAFRMPERAVWCVDAPASDRPGGQDQRPIVCSSLSHHPSGRGTTVISEASDLRTRIRNVIGEYARLPVTIDTISDDADLFNAGMTSHASVNVMLGLEAAFDVEFPDAMLKRSVFESISAIESALTELGAVAA